MNIHDDADPEVSATEAALQAIWSEVLQLPYVPLRQSFFEIGGNSLSAMRVVARVRDRFDVMIPVKIFFASPTIVEMATFVDAQATSAPLSDAAKT